MAHKPTFTTVDVPEGESGDWKVSRFTPDEFGRMLHNLKQPHRRIGKGPYTQLTHHGSIIMSDTPAEIRDLYPLMGDRSHGRMLFNGLGLGVALQGALDQPAVEHVTALEISPDVIALVGEYWKARYGERLTIVEADAFTWKPPKGVRYDAVWHDIWPTICGKHWPEMSKLHRKYGRRCDWQDSWCRYETRRAANVV